MEFVFVTKEAIMTSFEKRATLNMLNDLLKVSDASQNSNLNFIQMMNELLLLDSQQSTWKYSTPTMFKTASLIVQKITGSSIEDTFLMQHMPSFANEIEKFHSKHNDVNDVKKLLNEIISEFCSGK